MSYYWKQALKDNFVSAAAIYLVKHKLFPAERQQLRMAKIKRIKVHGSYDWQGLVRYQGLHNGETCFVIGNGPSVDVRDLDAMHAAGVCCFGANRISDVFSKTAWRPNYMCAMEHGFLNRIDGEQNVDDYALGLRRDGVEALFLNEEFKDRIVSAQSLAISKFIHCPLAPLYSVELLPFSDDIALYVSDLGSVTHFAIQIAFYMGFSTIYLYGVDNTYGKYLGTDGAFHVKECRTSHAEGIDAVRDDVTVRKVPKSSYEAYHMGGFADMRKSTMGYEACLRHARVRGVRILNASRGGLLEVFDRISLEEALEEASND